MKDPKNIFDGVVKAITDPTRLEDETTCGWRLMQITFADHIEMHGARTQSGGYDYNEKMQPYVIRQPIYLLVKTADAAMMELQAHKDQLQRELNSKHNALRLAEELTKKLEEQKVALEKGMTAAKERHDRELKALTDATNTRHTELTDLAIRSIIMLSSAERQAVESMARLGDHKAVLDWLTKRVPKALPNMNGSGIADEEGATPR